jgi:hypothetical protein
MMSTDGMGSQNANGGIDCWDRLLLSKRPMLTFEDDFKSLRLAARARASCSRMTSRGRLRPRRLSLPMTALRVTPISSAILAQLRPA